MSATNTGWRLLILDAPSPSLTVDENPITLELVSPGPQGPSGAAAAVTSVNGETGAVVLDAADVGAAASVHGHAIADVSGLQGALDGKAASSHTHTASQISDSSAVGRSVLTAADAAAARSALSAAASSHGHAIGDVTGLQTALDGKAATSHTHGVGDVTGLGTAATRNAPAAGNAASSEVVLGNDSRLSDTRTPTDGSVTGPKIASQAVTADKLAPNSVGTSEIKDKNVTLAKVADIPTQTLVGRGDLGVGSAQNIGLSSDLAIDPVTFELKLTNRSGNSIVGRSAGTAGAPTDIVAASDGEVLRRSGTTIGFGTIATAGIADDAVTYAKIQNVTATDRLLGRSTSGAGDIEEIVCTAFARGLLDDVDSAAARTTIGAAATSHTHTASEVSAAGSSGQVMFNSAGAFAGDAGLTYDSATDTLTVGTAGSGAIVMGNGEFLSNSTNGTVRIGTNGTASTDFAMTVDGTSWGFGVTLGTRRNSDGSTTAGGFLCNTPWRMGNAIDFALGGSNWFTISYQESTRGVLTVGLLVGSGGSAGAMVLCQNNQRGAANRVPSVSHDDPTLYIYAREAANPADYVRINHNTTNGTIESGRGKLTVKGASAVRIESSTGGFDLPATAGSNGQVLTTDGTNASWQTPTGGGGGVSEEDAIALAVAL